MAKQTPNEAASGFSSDRSSTSYGSSGKSSGKNTSSSKSKSSGGGSRDSGSGGTYTGTFNSAFSAARRDDRETFTWNGKSYSTELSSGGGGGGGSTKSKSKSSGGGKSATPTSNVPIPTARPDRLPDEMTVPGSTRPGTAATPLQHPVSTPTPRAPVTATPQVTAADRSRNREEAFDSTNKTQSVPYTSPRSTTPAAKLTPTERAEGAADAFEAGKRRRQMEHYETTQPADRVRKGNDYPSERVSEGHRVLTPNEAAEQLSTRQLTPDERVSGGHATIKPVPANKTKESQSLTRREQAELAQDKPGAFERMKSGMGPAAVADARKTRESSPSVWSKLSDMLGITPMYGGPKVTKDKKSKKDPTEDVDRARWAY